MHDVPASYSDLFVEASDGLRLHARDYGARLLPGVPAVCLPGLSRSAADFDCLARALSEGRGGPRRRVVALEYRGRGLSAYDSNWKNYDIAVEQADILAFLQAAQIDRAIFIGTSRGGIHIILLAVMRPGLFHAAVLNDIGPVLEPAGLARIKGYIGKYPPPENLEQAVAALKTINGAYFGGLSETDWQDYAKMSFCDEAGRWGTRYDPLLAKQIENWDEAKPAPALWPQFDSLKAIPFLAIRGENSDLLSAATLAEMGRRHPRLESMTVKGQGHAPLLIDAQSIARIGSFLARAEAK